MFIELQKNSHNCTQPMNASMVTSISLVRKMARDHIPHNSIVENPHPVCTCRDLSCPRRSRLSGA